MPLSAAVQLYKALRESLTGLQYFSKQNLTKFTERCELPPPRPS